MASPKVSHSPPIPARDLSPLPPSQEIGPSGSSVSPEYQASRVQRVSNASQPVLSALSSSEGGQIQTRPRVKDPLGLIAQQNDVIRDLKGGINLQDKKLDVQGKLIGSLRESNDRLDDIVVQLETEERGGLQRRLADSEKRATEKQESLQRQLADSEKRATEEREGLQRQLARLSEEIQEEQKKRRVLVFGNILLKSFDAHAQQHPKASQVPGECSLAGLLNHMAGRQYAQTTGSVFSFFGNFLKKARLEIVVQRLEESINAPFFRAACEVLSTHPLFQYVPVEREKEEKIIAFCRFVRKCVKVRNKVAHEGSREQALAVIDLIVERYGNQWRGLIEEAIGGKGAQGVPTH